MRHAPPADHAPRGRLQGGQPTSAPGRSATGAGVGPRTTTPPRPVAPVDGLDGVPVLAALGVALVALAIVAAAASAGGAPLGAAVATAMAAAAIAADQRRRIARLGTLLTAARQPRGPDAVTGLLDRAGVLDELDARLAARRPNEVVGVLVLDVDRIRVINHAIGHRAGDEVLEAVAARVEPVLRHRDVLGRAGGDEFVVVTSGLRSVADLDRLAERVLAQLVEPIALSDGSPQLVTASVGIAYVLRGAARGWDLLRDADLAVDRAKADGGSRHVVFDADLRAEVAARVELELELRRAVRDGELVVQYQPIASAATGRVEVVEALVRWRHPTRGLIPPGHFLTVASESGLIVELGHHVLATACREAVRWSTVAGRPVAVAVNLAERQLLDRSLIAMVRDVLRATGLAPAQLQLEISEELLVQRPERCLEVLAQLSGLGVRLALDDFGTAWGSLRQLKSLHAIDTLKLDRAFVAEVVDDPLDRTLVAAVVALAGSLGMAVVAEGVESGEQASVLHDLGVHLLQGFHLQRPAGADAIDAVLGRALPVPGSGPTTGARA